jgi:hypothetical protein
MKRKWILSATLALGLALALSLGAALAQDPSPAATVQQTPVSTSFTYQGKLIKDGSPVTDTCNFVFSLWDDWSGGTQFGGDSLNVNVPVNEGLFTANVLFWPGAFTGEARWLEIEVRCTGDADPITLSPRQELTAAPYAHGLVLPYTGSFSTTVGTDMFFLENTVGRALHAASGEDTAIWAQSSGSVGVDARSHATNGRGVFAWATTTTGANYGLFGQSDSTAGRGVYGYATATSGGNYGVHGQSDSNLGIGVLGEASASSGETYGVVGQAASTGGTGVWGWATASTGANYGVLGQSLSTDGYGVYGLASTTTGPNRGVYGETANNTMEWVGNNGAGVYGLASATSGNAMGVYGVSNSFYGYGVYGYNSATGGYAGYFSGDVSVTGNLSKGGGSFKIDHPLDPVGKYLYHSFVESPDMMNVYNGVIVLGENGAAEVELPAWFEALNGGAEHRSDYRYQLTPIGAPAPNLYIAQEIQDNRFQIAGGTPGLKVSWQVTGIRHDAYAEAYRIPVEQDKPAHERGTYLHPELYDQPEELGLDYRPEQQLLGEKP